MLAPERYIEDCCVTLVLKDQQFVTFRLDSAHASECGGRRMRAWLHLTFDNILSIG